MIIVCKECGVELEPGMQVCPLCDTPVNSGRSEKTSVKKESEASGADQKRHHPLFRILWQILAILLLSGIAATLIINLSIQGSVTWSVYPISVCLIGLSYACLFSFWRPRIIMQLVSGWALSALVLVILSSLIDKTWPVRLALPLLCAVNTVALLLILGLKLVRTKGLNIFAITLVAIALLCLLIEGIISLHFQNAIKFEWSAIVAACLLPVTIAIFFMYFRTRNNAELKKIFHT